MSDSFQIGSLFTESCGEWGLVFDLELDLEGPNGLIPLMSYCTVCFSESLFGAASDQCLQFHLFELSRLTLSRQRPVTSVHVVLHPEAITLNLRQT